MIKKIKTLLQSIETSGEDDAQLRRVKQCWQIGKLVNQYKEKTGQPVKAIAEELNADKVELQKYSQFHKTYRDGYESRYHGKAVQWHFFVLVLPLKDPKQREFYLEQTCRHNWNKYELKRRLKADYYHNFQDAKTFEEAAMLPRTEQALYTYTAWVKRVIDGDTLVLDIDTGFKTRQEHRVRLRGIDCPEMSTPAGEAAKQFVTEELNQCVIADNTFAHSSPTLPLVVVKTYKQGMYGRYIVDVFYLPGENNPELIAKNGKLLNQVLLSNGLAQSLG